MSARTAQREDDRALEVIGRIYDASVDPSRWCDAVGAVVSFVGGSKGLLFSAPDPSDHDGFAVPHGLDDATIRQLRDSQVVNALWSRTAVETGLLEDRRRSPRDPGESCTPALYRDFVGEVGSGRICTGVSFGASSATACTVFRSGIEPPFTAAERERMRTLVPHLARAVEVMDRLREAERASDAAEASLDRISCGVVLLGAQGEVLFANQAARRIASERDGIALVETRGGRARRRLAFDHPRARAQVDAVLGECLKHRLAGGHHQHGALVPRASGRAPYLLRCASLGAEDQLRVENDAARAIAFISDPEEGASFDRHVLKQLYRLTEAEASLAELLCGGERLAEAAVSLGITLNTARAHLKNIFQKTGVSRQPELVKALLTLSAYR